MNCPDHGVITIYSVALADTFNATYWRQLNRTLRNMSFGCGADSKTLVFSKQKYIMQIQVITSSMEEIFQECLA